MRPFSTVNKVCSSLELTLGGNDKDCVEAQYARVISVPLKETSTVLCLQRNGKNLTTQEYAESLIKHMGDSKSKNTLTLADLN